MQFDCLGSGSLIFIPVLQPPAAAAAAAVLARDLETVTFYDSKGEFAGVRRAGSGKPIEVRQWLLMLHSF
jgi:hypothetical protein